MTGNVFGQFVTDFARKHEGFVLSGLCAWKPSQTHQIHGTYAVRTFLLPLED
jgi:hypothetical protein